MNKCTCDSITPIEDFESIDQFIEFEKTINRMVERNELEKVPVYERYSIIDFGESWYKCSCGSFWRFVFPDFPFKGMFVKVTRGVCGSFIEIEGFDSMTHFYEIENSLLAMVNNNELEEVFVSKPYSGSVLFKESWFKCPCGSIWRLVKPDSPFKGVFIRFR
jgi:hypothetical protein